MLQSLNVQTREWSDVEEGWLDIPDPSIGASEIEARIHQRMTARLEASSGVPEGSVQIVAERLRRRMIGDDVEGGLAVRERECDIVPRNYAIDWRVPILGPVHAAVRRVINAEIRRYLMPSLERQSYINRRLVGLVSDLIEENENLRREVAELRKTRDQGTT